MLYHQTTLTQTDIIRAFEDLGAGYTTDLVNQILEYIHWLEDQRIRRVDKTRQLAAKIGNILPTGSLSVALSCHITSHYDRLQRGKNRKYLY